MNRVQFVLKKTFREEEYETGVRKFWIVNNTTAVMEKLEEVNRSNRAESVTTHDFSTLYTTLPHKDLIDKLGKVVDLAFDKAARMDGGRGWFLKKQGRRVIWKNKNFF